MDRTSSDAATPRPAMTIELSFLSAIALAGAATVIGEMVVHRSDRLQSEYFPEPAIGGLAVAIGIAILSFAGVDITFPVHGRPVDFLVALLTTNMGLHITPELIRREARLYPVFLTAGVLLFVTQLAVVLPVALAGGGGIREALLYGPISFVGAPFNLNPPSQIPPIADLFTPVAANPERQARASMMLGIFAGFILAGLAGKHLFQDRESSPPQPSPGDKSPSADVWTFATRQFRVVVVILGIIAVAFGLQSWLLDRFSWLKEDYLPVIVLSYLLGATVRLVFEGVAGPNRFPEQPLGVLLLGPTMGIVLSYALMSIPLVLVRYLGFTQIAMAALAVATSFGAARLVLPVFARLTDRYYATVISTAFLAVTTGWGPLAMSYLRRLTTAQGPVPVMPIVLPLNAFFVFPWMAILLTRLLLRLFG